MVFVPRLPSPEVSAASSASIAKVKEITAYFLNRSGWKPRCTPEDKDLRTSIIYEITQWNVYGDVQAVEKIADGSCAIAEKTYGFTGPAHRRFVALYTACLMHVDDVGDALLEAIAQFAARLIRGESQLSPALESLTKLLREAHNLWTQVGADIIIASTVEGVTAMYLEYTTQDMVLSPRATWWPGYMRTRTGVCSAYAHCMFMNTSRETPESYLVAMPYIEHFVGAANDILSFYKEELTRETKNYIHIRAAVEGLSPANILERLVKETLRSMNMVDTLTKGDPELSAIWEEFSQGYIEFHIGTKRYKLAELGFC